MRPILETLEDRFVPSTVTGTWSDGVWRWDSVDGWGHITPQLASQLAADDGSNVVGTFVNGLWRWSDQTFQWQKLSDFSPSDFQIAGNGAVYANFATIGLWRWTPEAGWAQLSAFTAQFQWTVNSQGVFFGLFSTPSNNLWRWAPDTGWSQIGQNFIQAMEADDGGNLFARVGAGSGQNNIARWSPITGWTVLQQYHNSLFEVSDQGTAYLNDPGQSFPLPPTPAQFLIYTPATGLLTQVRALLPSEMDAARTGDLFASFSGNLLSRYSLATQSWTDIDTRAPVNMAVGSDNSLYAAFGTDGLWHWTAGNGWVSLTARPTLAIASQTR